MGSLHSDVLTACDAERVVFSNHADDRLRDRKIAAWQVVEGARSGRLLLERPGAEPNPVVELEQVLADGTAIKVVWAYARELRVAVVVTVHFFDR